MSLPLEAPCSPHLSYMGMLILGGQGMGYNASGRITKFLPKWTENNMILEIGLDPVVEGQGVKIFQNKSLVAYPQVITDNKYTYIMNRANVVEKICVSAIPMNASSLWNAYPGPLSDVVDNRLELSWAIDSTTDKVSIFHSFDEDHSDARCISILQGNTEIDVNRVYGDATVRITGMDGDEAPGGNYVVFIQTVSGVTSVRITGVTVGVSTDFIWSDQPIQFSSGLLLDITYVGTMESRFDVSTHIPDNITITNPISAAHYLMVRAHRFEDDETADSEWVSQAVQGAVDPVSNIVSTYESAGAVRISFTMPDQIGISGYRIYLSRPWNTDNDMPWWHPILDNTATSGQDVSVVIGNLSEGTYYYYIRAYDSNGNDDDSANVKSFVLQGSGIEDGSILPPISIKGWSPSHGDVSLEVVTLMNEDSIKIYTDNRSGIIDWDNPIASYDATGEDGIREAFEGTSFGKYLITLTGYNDGLYLFGARCFVGDEHDGNTDRFISVRIFSNGLQPPYSLFLREVVE